MTIKILGRISSINVRKVVWTCKEIGLDFIREDWGAGFASTQDPAYLAMNPNGLVPVLIDEDGPIWESNPICRYLAAKFGRADLLPAEPRARAQVEQWMDWQATDLAGASRFTFLALVRHQPPDPDPATLAAGIKGWNRHMAILEGQLERTGAYVAGSSFTLGDVVVGLGVNRWLRTPIDRPDAPAIAAYHTLLCERPAFRELGPDGAP